MARCTRYNIMWEFVSDLHQVGCFLLVSTINKNDRHDITDILLNVVYQNTIIGILDE
jgi:hypothetical protein